MAPPTAYKTATSSKTTTGFEADSSGDEDDDSRSNFSTDSRNATVLAFVDGLCTSARDQNDWRISRLGGLPTFPPMKLLPPTSASLCLSCGTPMPLLTQIYAPFDESNDERVVYTFACASKTCKRKEGSVRAFRANVPWPEEVVEEVEAPIRPSEKKVEGGLGSLIFGSDATAERSAVAESNDNLFNPFAPSTASSNTFSSANPFAPASDPFLPASNPFAATANPFAIAPPPSLVPSAAPPISNATRLADSMSSLSLAPTSKLSTPVVEAPSLHWPKSHHQPSYPAQYLTTSYEPITPPSKNIPLPSSSTASTSRIQSSAQDDDGLGEPHYREGKSAGGRTKKGGANHKPTIKGASSAGGGDTGGWGSEGYEVQKVSGVDEVFLRFLERVGREGQQVVRYNPGRAPLPFSMTSSTFHKIFIPSIVDSTGAADAFGAYNPSSLPRCGSNGCPGRRKFEYQLMPHLLSVLGRLRTGTPGKKGEEGEGVDFATVMVFTCELECVAGGEAEGGDEAWKEELVLVEWED